MTELLELAIDAHGGLDHWETKTWFRAQATITGAIWTLKKQAGLFNDVTLEGETRDQRLKIAPFPRSHCYSTWEPDRQTIESDQGIVQEERKDPAFPFAGQVRQAPWDELQAAYFASEANWNYFVAPFLFARADFVTEELDPWTEDGEKWRTLLVTYPESVGAPSRQQTYYFDDSGLLRRLDYAVEILGGGPAVHSPSEYQEFGGIMIPTRRVVYVRNPDGSPVRASVSIDIQFGDVTFG